MAAVRSKDTTPELLLRKALFSKGFRYRLYVKGIPGSPDIVLSKYNAVIFVQGCFWHGHKGCKKFSIPKTNTAFWQKKIHDNICRDTFVRDNLLNSGWRVLWVWQCALANKKRLNKTIEKIVSWLKSSNDYLEIAAES